MRDLKHDVVIQSMLTTQELPFHIFAREISPHSPYFLTATMLTLLRYLTYKKSDYCTFHPPYIKV